MLWQTDGSNRPQRGVRAEASAGPGGVESFAPLEVLRRHELRRRRRLLRIITLGIMGPLVLLIPAALIPKLDIVTLVAVGIGLAFTLIAYFLNALDRVNAGGFALLGGLALAICWEVIAKSGKQNGLDLSDLRLYDLFALPIVLSGVVISRRGPIIIGAGTILFTVVSLLALHHTPTLQQYWDGTYQFAIAGSVYDVVAVAVVIQLLTAISAWLGSDSVRRALLDASRAEELSAANELIQEQAQRVDTQRRRMQEGIAHIQQVHAAVARGQWDARASVTEGELLPVAMSLNLLLDRLSRLNREQDQRTRGDLAAHELALALRRRRAGDVYTPPAYTGTPLDEVLVELSFLRGQQPPTTGHITSAPTPSPALDLSAQSWPDLGGTAAPVQWPSEPASASEGYDANALPAWLRRDLQGR